MSSPDGRRGTLLAAAALVIGIYSAFSLGTAPTPNPNEQSRLELSVALAEFGSVAIDPVIPAYGLPFDRSIKDGRTYCDKAPGLSLLAVPLAGIGGVLFPDPSIGGLPAYGPLRHLATWLLVGLPGALFPFAALRERPVPQRAALAVLFALATPVLPYATVLFSHVPAGILVAVACLCVLGPDYAGGIPPVRRSALGGLALGLAVTTEYPTAVVGPVLGLTLLVRRAPVSVIAAFAAGSFVGVLPAPAYHQAAFGSMFATAYRYKADDWHAVIHASGFMGVTVPSPERLHGVLLSAKRGMLAYCPLLFALPVGLWAMGRAGAIPYLALTVLYVAFAAGFADWQAGWCAAARHLLPWLLVSIVPFAAGVQRLASQRVGRGVLAILTAFSLVGSLGSVALSPFFPEHFSAPLGQLVLPALFDGYAAPTALWQAAAGPRWFAVSALSVTTVAAATWALATLGRDAGDARRAGMGILGGMALWGGLLWWTAPPLDAGQAEARADVLRRVGYVP